MYLVITGLIPVPWEENATLKIKDLNGNLLYIPTTTVFSLTFSLFSMIKAIVYFNIARIHVGVRYKVTNVTRDIQNINFN